MTGIGAEDVCSVDSLPETDNIMIFTSQILFTVLVPSSSVGFVVSQDVALCSCNQEARRQNR